MAAVPEMTIPIRFLTTVEFEPENLAWEVWKQSEATDQIFDFIMTLDQFVADYDFTVRLRDALTEALRVEDEATSGDV
jgi:hypothetical protein